ncbi:hypothetical protein TI39_contig4296g00020 [Zymoseptoria brevis]|uniref:F-box domain-containing protein n=1 Tax=Zymoseptoria brevis TaxID=1047168 RepID=A0A0F4G8A2_9PEZI|nr:hypothetical protein TI39_contig4296g00020 [Zymoseptoria brevis]
MTNITDLPHEILTTILLLATKANERENESFTYGLTQAPLPLQQTKLTKYVRGPVTAESLRWDATVSIRQVCSAWHEWALSYNLEHVFERRWRGSERWAELSPNRRKYSLYELMEKPSGCAVYRDPLSSLRSTDRAFTHLPHLTQHVRRLWFNGFYTAESDKHILSIVAECSHLQFLSVPWTILRRGTAEDWIDLLNVSGEGIPLHSLELQAVCLPSAQALTLESDAASNPNPLLDPRVSFSHLHRLKIFGNTLHNPISDTDISLIARTATSLHALDITNLSTVSVAAVLELVHASRHTLQVLEHSPRSSDGFYHPYPGAIPDSTHICTLLTSPPKLRDLSISVPTLCPDLFRAVDDVKWQGDFQVRATDLCGCHPSTSTATRTALLGTTLSAARDLIAARARLGRKLSIEIFFNGCIFEPGKNLVHGDFVFAEVASRGAFPRGVVGDAGEREGSMKGPYGTTGVYGKDVGDGEGGRGSWDQVWEEEFLEAGRRGWVGL